VKSKYAPIMALTVLVILVILALGWFLAIRPQLTKASEIRSTTDSVQSNTAQIQTGTAKIKQYEADLAALEPLDETLALNLPNRLDVEGYRTRILAAIDRAKVEIVSLELGGSYAVDGWEVEPQTRVSNSIARLFQTAPVGQPADATVPDPAATPAEGEQPGVAPGAYSPIVTPDTVPGPIVDELWAVPVSLQFAGTYAEMAKLFSELSDPQSQLFLITDVRVSARNGDSSPIAGVSDAEDGDVLVSLQGVFYLLYPSTEIVDDGTPEPARPGKNEPFVPGEPAGEQPGAR